MSPKKREKIDTTFTIAAHARVCCTHINKLICRLSLVESRAYTKSKHTPIHIYDDDRDKKKLLTYTEQEPIRLADSKLSSRYLNYFNLLYSHCH